MFFDSRIFDANRSRISALLLPPVLLLRGTVGRRGYTRSRLGFRLDQ